MLATLGAGLAAVLLPLSGTTIVIDPGHQLGNHNFPAQVNRLVPAGGFSKPCNTTGTSTTGGYPEATFAWDISWTSRSPTTSPEATGSTSAPTSAASTSPTSRP